MPHPIAARRRPERAGLQGWYLRYRRGDGTGGSALDQPARKGCTIGSGRGSHTHTHARVAVVALAPQHAMLLAARVPGVTYPVYGRVRGGYPASTRMLDQRQLNLMSHPTR